MKALKDMTPAELASLEWSVIASALAEAQKALESGSPAGRYSWLDAPVTLARQRAAAGYEAETTGQEPKYRFEHGRIVNRASGEAIPLDEPVFVFRARDRHAVTGILSYHQCLRDKGHAGIVMARAFDFERFAQAHPDRMKEPDTDA